jgi:uncharacterized membrane protein
MRGVITAAALAGLVASGCGEEQDPGGDDDVVVDAGVTYTEHIKPILDGACISCHASYLAGADRNGAPEGVDFDTFEAASASGSAANTRIQAGTMPPSGALTSEQQAVFQKWVDEGFPE